MGNAAEHRLRWPSSSSPSWSSTMTEHRVHVDALLESPPPSAPRALRACQPAPDTGTNHPRPRMGWHGSAAPPDFLLTAEGYLQRGQGAVPIRVPLRRKIRPERLQAHLGAGPLPGTERAAASMPGPRPRSRGPPVGWIIPAAPPDLPAATCLDVIRRECPVQGAVPFGGNVRMLPAERVLRCHSVARADRTRGPETGPILNPRLPFVPRVISALPPYHLRAAGSHRIRRQRTILERMPFQRDVGMGFR
jgi:hypothetical protein